MNEYQITICKKKFRYKLGVGFFETFRINNGVTVFQIEEMALKNLPIIFTCIYEAIEYYNSAHKIDSELSKEEIYDLIEFEYISNSNFIVSFFENIANSISKIRNANICKN